MESGENHNFMVSVSRYFQDHFAAKIESKLAAFEPITVTSQGQESSPVVNELKGGMTGY